MFPYRVKYTESEFDIQNINLFYNIHQQHQNTFEILKRKSTVYPPKQTRTDVSGHAIESLNRCASFIIRFLLYSPLAIPGVSQDSLLGGKKYGKTGLGILFNLFPPSPPHPHIIL